MIHLAPSMIAKGSCCLFHDDKGWAELADIILMLYFFKNQSLKYVIFLIQAKYKLFLIFSYYMTLSNLQPER